MRLITRLSSGAVRCKRTQTVCFSPICDQYCSATTSQANTSSSAMQIKLFATLHKSCSSHSSCVHLATMPPSKQMSLLVRYPVLTIQSTVSAISSGCPNRPSGISLLISQACEKQDIVVVILTCFQLIATSGQHGRVLNQSRRYSIDSDTLAAIGTRQPVYQTVKCRL